MVNLWHVVASFIILISGVKLQFDSIIPTSFAAEFPAGKPPACAPGVPGSTSKGSPGLPLDPTHTLLRLLEDKKAIAAECMKGFSLQTAVYAKNEQGVINQKPYLYTSTKSPMKAGFFMGMLLSYSRNYCEGTGVKPDPQGSGYYDLVGQPPGKLNEHDVLNHIPVIGKLPEYFIDEPSSLEKATAIQMQLGTLESDGDYREGRDAAAANISADSAEAGAFQDSYDAVGDGPEQVPRAVYAGLLDKYHDGTGPECLTDTFKINIAPENSNQESWGWGEGRHFQEVMKRCPALSFDFQAYLMRRNLAHNGPLIRRQAQPKVSCLSVLRSLRPFLAKDGEFCKNIATVAKELPAAGSAIAQSLETHADRLQRAAARKPNGLLLVKGSYDMQVFARPPMLEFKRAAFLRRTGNSKNLEEAAKIVKNPVYMSELLVSLKAVRDTYVKNLNAVQNSINDLDLQVAKVSSSERSRLELDRKNMIRSRIQLAKTFLTSLWRYSKEMVATQSADLNEKFLDLTRPVLRSLDEDAAAKFTSVLQKAIEGTHPADRLARTRDLIFKNAFESLPAEVTSSPSN